MDFNFLPCGLVSASYTLTENMKDMFYDGVSQNVWRCFAFPSSWTLANPKHMNKHSSLIQSLMYFNFENK